MISYVKVVHNSSLLIAANETLFIQVGMREKNNRRPDEESFEQNQYQPDVGLQEVRTRDSKYEIL